MDILMIHSSDPTRGRGGGGGYAMYRLHLGLRKVGINSKILCGNKDVESPHVFQIPRSAGIRSLESKIEKVTSRLGLNDIHYLNSFGVKQHDAYLNADLINFHGTHGFFSYLAIPSLTKEKPGVFTLHDIWPFTGHCAYSYDCQRWKIGCGQCPYPEAHPAIKRDNTRLEWKLKNWVYNRSNLTIVTLSSRLTEQAKQSILGRFPIYQIPNGIDQEVYQPLDPEYCRSLLGIPPGKKVLLFAALKLSQHNKGRDLLVKALRAFPESLKAETILLTLGQNGYDIARAAEFDTHKLGYIGDGRSKAIAYSAADVTVSPTRAESFGLVLLESMACGTPTVSFDVGGVSDLVRPGITGHLAESENPQDLLNGIVQLLEDKALRSRLGQQCRAVVLKEYTLELQVQRYIELYRQVLSSHVTQTKDHVVSQAKVTKSECR